ncbi:MAG TPA: hypothetical protein DCR97_03440 [Deltaproteobacteria bacterium]|nr:hypothetical protein [Deltaproteobacteria bacterium]
MSYWFGYRAYNKDIDLLPGAGILEGPFDSYDAAKRKKESIRGNDIQKTSIFPAEDKEQAYEKIANETWMI